MRIDVLGPLRVTDNGRPIEISRPKERALLAALLLDAPSIVPLDRLVLQLWGDEPPARAIGSLHAYISNLRRLLEPDRPARAPSSVIVSRPPGYSLVVDPDDVDATRFEHSALRGRELLVGSDAAGALAALDEALALWRGPAYADFPYDDFVQPAVRRLEELRATASEARADALLALGRHDEVVADAEATLVGDPLRERVWCQLMVALYRAGRQADALAAYQRARAALDDVGVEPGPALRALEQAVLAQATHLDAPVPAQHSPQPEPAAPAPTTTMTLPGRDEALRHCLDALSDVAAGATRIAVVSGEPGIGKTALARAVLDAATRTGAATATGQCPEGGGAPALWPWAQVVRQLAGPDSSEFVDLIAGSAELPAAPRGRVFTGVLDRLREMSRERPVVVLIDDVQWADEVSHALLQLAVGDLAGSRVLLLLTLREPTEEVSGALTTTRSVLARSPLAQWVRLDGLDRSAMTTLVTQLAGDDVTDEVVEILLRRTGGNPFFAGQLVTLLAAEGKLDARRVAAAALPTGVRDVVRRRLDRLPEDVNALLAVAAVVGPDVDIRVLERVSGLDEDELLQLLDLLVAAGVVAERADLPGTYRFSHDLVRDAIVDALPGIRRSRLHDRAAAALVDLYGEQDRRIAHDLARHSVAAVATAGAEPAVRRLLRSSRIALVDLALELSERQLRTALELLESIDDVATRDHLEVQVQSRLAQVLFHDPDCTAEADARNARALHLCRQDDVEQLGGVLLGIGTYAPLAGRFDEGLAAGRDLLALAQQHEHRQLAAAAHYILAMQVFTGDLTTAREHIETALATSVADYDAGVPMMWVTVPIPTQHAVHALALGLGGDESWREALQAGVAFARRERNGWAMAWVVAFGGWAAVVNDDTEALRDLLAVAQDLAVGVEQTDAVVDAFSAWLDATAADGDLQHALAIIDDAVHRLRRVNDGLFRVPVQDLAVRLLVRGGRGSEAAVRAAAAHAEAVQLGQLTWARRLAEPSPRDGFAVR